MSLNNPLAIDRQTLLASIPDEWEAKFKEELSRSPILKLVAIQISQQIIEVYRQRVELALNSGEVELRKLQSPYLDIKKGKNGKHTVSLERTSKTTRKSIAAEEQVEHLFKALNFWESSASYMWFNLTKMAFAEMEKDLGQVVLEQMDAPARLETLYRYIFDEASDSLKSNFSSVLQVYIDQAVQLILNKYDLPSKSLQELEWLSGLGQQKAVPNAPATSPDLFANGISSNFATCKLLWESVNILTQRSDLQWQLDEDGKLTYTSTLKDGRGRLIFWVTDSPEEQYPEALAGEAALAVIETFDIRAACMHLIYAAHVTTLDRPWEEEFVVDDAQISSYLGLDKRKDLTKEQRLKLIERISEQPAQILTFLHWPQQGNIESFYVEKSRLWEVAIGYHGQRNLLGDIKCTGLTIRCRAGMWAKYFLNKRGSEEGNAFYQYGVLSKTLLQTITRVWQHSEGAARMLAWLSFRMRVSTNQVMLTSTLMEVAYGSEKVIAAQRNRDLRSELANTWDRDLLVLHEAGLTIEFDPITYPAEIQPDWKAGGRGEKKRPKGFWELLRNSRLYIHPPREIADGIAKLRRKRRTISATHQPATSKPIPVSSVLNGEQIKRARESQGWSQEELGKKLGKTKMWISLIERDKRSIKPEDAAQLRAILNLNA
ncbi:MAG: helix-turn-helix domain-containing protein [Trichocoleus desertorum ATA4-8-CV12]|jgi:DNA-binding XRE family transcriptional regulator|nr:helix-turn-helix domain-containing protein [Trichocoleus desertorum ATA4-8-CV12]